MAEIKRRRELEEAKEAAKNAKEAATAALLLNNNGLGLGSNGLGGANVANGLANGLGSDPRGIKSIQNSELRSKLLFFTEIVKYLFWDQGFVSMGLRWIL